MSHENRAIRKGYSNRRDVEAPALRSSVNGKHFEKGNFRKRWHNDNHVTSPPELNFPRTQIQNDR